MLKPAIAYICNNLDFQDNYAQRKLISEYANNRKYQIEQWFEDTVEWENRFTPDKQALKKLKKWIKDNKEKTIIMVGVGRITLDFDEFVRLEEEFNNNNIVTIYLGCDLSLNEEENILLEKIEMALSTGGKFNCELTNIYG